MRAESDIHGREATRILILDSIDDPISRRRADMIARSQRFRRFSIQHCYLVDASDYDGRARPEPTGIPFLDDFAELRAWEASGSPLPYERCLDRVDRAIEDSKPEVVLLHTGIAFHRHPGTVVRVLREIRRRKSGDTIQTTRQAGSRIESWPSDRADYSAMNDERGAMNGGKDDIFPDYDDRVFFLRLLVESAEKTE